MKLFQIGVSLALVGALSACAQASGDVRPVYTPATAYADYNCDQLQAKLLEIQQQVMTVSGQQDQKRKIDQAATGVGLVLFWPALIAMPLTADHKRELGELKGQYEAIGRESEVKQCRIGAVPPPPSPAPKS